MMKALVVLAMYAPHFTAYHSPWYIAALWVITYTARNVILQEKVTIIMTKNLF